MSISIITPHYNEFEGLKRIYTCLLKQNADTWEWIIVDDYSDAPILLQVDKWIHNINENRIRFIRNESKSNGSICRNQGAKEAYFENLVFLDTDDYISEEFVMNRSLDFNEFAVFKNYAVVSNYDIQEKRTKLEINHLDYFLKAKFLWQTTALLWKKKFFMEIGQFDPNLQRLQDVELTIRALFAGKHYKIIDNAVDFYYCAKPINSKPDIVRKSCLSVNYLITKINSNYTLDGNRHAFIKSFYFACVNVLHRSKDRKDVVFVKESLKLFKKLKYITSVKFYVGYQLLILYQFQMISDSLFIKINRHFFK